MTDVEDRCVRVTLVDLRLTNLGQRAEALLHHLEGRARAEGVRGRDEEDVVAHLLEGQCQIEGLGHVVRLHVSPEVEVADVGAARFELRPLGRKDYLRRADRHDLEPAPA